MRAGYGQLKDGIRTIERHALTLGSRPCLKRISRAAVFVGWRLARAIRLFFRPSNNRGSGLTTSGERARLVNGWLNGVVGGGVLDQGGVNSLFLGYNPYGG